MAEAEEKLETNIDSRRGSSAGKMQGQVLSPKNDTEVGREKMRRSLMFKKAGKLTESWKLLRECKKFIEEYNEGWKKTRKRPSYSIGQFE